MAFGYNSKLTEITDILKAYNTTTASPDLSSGLDVRIDDDDIVADDPEINKPRSDRMPCIYVRIHQGDETPEAIGEPGASGVSKNKVVEYDIIGIYGKHGAHSAHSELLNDIYTLADNIESVLREEVQLDGSALWSNVETTLFSPPLNFGEGFAKAVQITLKAEYMFR